MDAPDPRTRHKVALNPASSSASSTALQNLLLLDALYVLALLAGKHVLAAEVGVFWLLTRVLACGAVGMVVWTVWKGELRKERTIEWSVVGTASILVFLRYAGLLIALYRLPSARTIMFVHFSSFWFKSVLNPIASPQKTVAVVLALSISFLSDSGLDASSMKSLVPAYGALILEAFSSSVLEHTQGVLLSSLGQSLTTTVGVVGAFMFSLIFSVVRQVLTESPPFPPLAMWSLSVLPLLAFVLLLRPSQLPHLMRSSLSPSQYLVASFALTFAAAQILGATVDRVSTRWTDSLIAIPLLYGMWPQSSDALNQSPYANASRVARTYLKAILSNPESRKIFYFLMLNMCYMLVQMLYGIWTNSLGLISDAIHMAFDCMAIGVGLVASVMAQWPPNEQFTYGFGRIETLSGFANGIFLILISIFIVFEAIQRLLDPPEMNTSQLLLVSSLGLAVNLFGMFAMGGHHHGGHSHSHGHGHGDDNGRGHDHGHGHDHSHAQQPEQPLDCHEHDHDHDEHTHSHTHSHSHEHPAPQPSHAHSHSHSHGNPGHSLGLHVDLHAAGKHSHEEPRSHLHANDRLRHLTAESDHLDSPITPNYKFGHDDHFDTHDASAHMPNLHDHSHAHHSHEGHSHNMRGIFLHVMADTLGSVGVIVSTLLIQLYGWTGFDPIASLFIAVLIAASVVPLVIDTGKVLALDLGDQSLNIQETLSELREIEGLASYTKPRFWPKDSSSTIGSIRIQLSPMQSSDPSTGRPSFARVDKVIGRVDKLLRNRIVGLEELTIQIEEPHTFVK